jgi:hypothetical protein
VDRRFNRARYSAERMLAAFAARLKDAHAVVFAQQSPAGRGAEPDSGSRSSRDRSAAVIRPPETATA